MKVTVKEIHRQQDDVLDVVFSCASGEGRARWASGEARPAVNVSYDIELDVDEAIVLGKNAFPDAGPAQISHDDGVGSLTAIVDSIDSDQVAFLKLQPDALFMIETESELEPSQWLTLRVPFESLRITPISAH